MLGSASGDKTASVRDFQTEKVLYTGKTPDGRNSRPFDNPLNKDSKFQSHHEIGQR